MIYKTSMSSVFMVYKTSMSYVFYAFKDFNVFCFMIYKTSMSFFLQTSTSSALSFIGLNVLIFIFHRTQHPCLYIS